MYKKPQLNKSEESSVKDFSVVHPFIRPLFISIVILLLSACTVFQRPAPAETPLSTNEREQHILAMQQFSLQASVGIKTPEESLSGNLRWQQEDGVTYDARLSNFLGISLFELSETEQGSAITIKGETYRAVDTSTLLLQLSGWSMPLHDMPLWLRGLPGSKGRDIMRDEFGRVTAFNLTDSTGIVWQLQYQGFFPDSLALPRRMLLQSSDSQIKIVIRSWQ
ncbi:Outer membrane lipoprotein LolB [Rheinheimera pacifica]|uniref:Outer-membrane lipoprotein LolB n=1 Tax=Rheinheimera pacifica TaxID=173990 RepID=A0A1H6N477_9GAMM|nr:lipoprotein insertase outer membrane protein LolB [Rheinheimera pacifica]SEI06977.1 Outer membrane lipoprotein LolB [Rheinheimera pacifica]